MQYHGKLYGMHGGTPVPLVLTSKDIDRMERENAAMRAALKLAAKWGIRSDGFSAEVSDSIRIWVDAGMAGDSPTQPDYYPEEYPEPPEDPRIAHGDWLGDELRDRRMEEKAEKK